MVRVTGPLCPQPAVVGKVPAGTVTRVSTPPFLRLPACARAEDVSSGRGHFATLRAEPSAAAAGRPVLLVPGFTGSKEDFIALLEPLAAAGRSVTAVDQRGQYETPGGDDPSAYDLKQLAEDVLALVSVLGAPAHLVGHSFGGLVARTAALADPRAVASLTLLDSGPAAIPHPSSSNLALMVQALPTTDLPTIWAVKRQMERAGKPPLAPEIEDFLRLRFLANSPVALRRHAEQLLAEPDRTEELAALGLPVLVAFGTGDDAWPPAVQRDMGARLAAEVVEIEGAAHSPAAERPEETARALVRFWDATD
jgi:pimeloyl-ACP methyl ester carboxylesterase